MKNPGYRLTQEVKNLIDGRIPVAGEVNGCILYLPLAFVSLHLKAILIALFEGAMCCSSPRPFYNYFYPPLQKELK